MKNFVAIPILMASFLYSLPAKAATIALTQTIYSGSFVVTGTVLSTNPSSIPSAGPGASYKQITETTYQYKSGPDVPDYVVLENVVSYDDKKEMVKLKSSLPGGLKDLSLDLPYLETQSLIYSITENKFVANGEPQIEKKEFLQSNVLTTIKTYEVVPIEPVPEPFTILGATTAFSFGVLFKRKLSKK